MMEKKRSLGVTIFSIYYILLAFACFAGFLGMAMLIKNKAVWMLGDAYSGKYTQPQTSILGAISLIVVGALFLISSIFLFKLNAWGYKLPLLALLICMLTGQWLFGLAILIHIIFFTRPKVREQFR